MEEGKRQRQVAGIVQEEFNDIFRRLGLNMINGGMVSISSVKITPDLLEARIYLSFFQIADTGLRLKEYKTEPGKSKKNLPGVLRVSCAAFRCCIFMLMIHWSMCLKWKSCLKILKKRTRQNQSRPVPKREL